MLKHFAHMSSVVVLQENPGPKLVGFADRQTTNHANWLVQMLWTCDDVCPRSS